MAKNPVGKTTNTAKPATPRTRKPRSQVRRGTATIPVGQLNLFTTPSRRICKFLDCGWCYAPKVVETNDQGGACMKPLDCPAHKEQEKEWSREASK